MIGYIIKHKIILKKDTKVSEEGVNSQFLQNINIHKKVYTTLFVFKFSTSLFIEMYCHSEITTDTPAQKNTRKMNEHRRFPREKLMRLLNVQFIRWMATHCYSTFHLNVADKIPSATAALLSANAVACAARIFIFPRKRTIYFGRTSPLNGAAEGTHLKQRNNALSIRNTLGWNWMGKLSSHSGGA